jgi:hypothetical protein
VRLALEEHLEAAFGLHHAEADVVFIAKKKGAVRHGSEDADTDRDVAARGAGGRVSEDNDDTADTMDAMLREIISKPDPGFARDQVVGHEEP